MARWGSSAEWEVWTNKKVSAKQVSNVNLSMLFPLLLTMPTHAMVSIIELYLVINILCDLQQSGIGIGKVENSHSGTSSERVHKLCEQPILLYQKFSSESNGPGGPSGYSG